VNRAIVRHVVFPLHERLKRKPTFSWLPRLEASQWAPPDRLAEMQWQRLELHLRFAYEHVPYYRELFDAHDAQPWRIQSPDDLRRIPFLTRDLLRSEFDRLAATVDLGPIARRTSGGSTGEPAVVLSDMERMGFGEAARLRAHRWYGLEPGAREICFWASPIEITKQDRLRAVRDWLINSRVISAHHMNEAQMAAHGEAVARYRPEKIVAYAHALYLLARYLGSRGWTPPSGLRAIFTTAEMLYEFQREAIQSVFRAPVASEYGARDAGLMAIQCPEGRHHIVAEGILIEIDSPGPDGLGEIVATNLYSSAMPIIRYRTGDMGELDTEACPCGRSLPVLKRLEGRRMDFLVTPDGRVMHPTAVVHILREFAPIRVFQIVQEAVDHVVIALVPAPGFTAEMRSEIRRQVQRRLGDEVRVDVELTESIAPAKSGKHRFVISKVADTYLDRLLGASA
jgi:phenylacetate-coenzyme A ligase PaaK-like adenylate-forming protein